MKNLFFAAFAGAAVIVAAGCTSTVNDGSTFATSFNSDSVSGRYPRTVDEVYAASVAVIKSNGLIQTEFIPHDTTNTVRALSAKVNSERVFVRVEAVSPAITQVQVQARTLGGLTDIDLVHELEKEIGIKLATTPR